MRMHICPSRPSSQPIKPLDEDTLRANIREEQWQTLREAPIWILQALGRGLLTLTSPVWLPFALLWIAWRDSELGPLLRHFIILVLFWGFVFWLVFR